MLRECARVLLPRGRLGLFTIHLAAGLSSAERARAMELGPTFLGADSRPELLCERAGLEVVLFEDVTSAFVETAVTVRDRRQEHEARLRREEGDEAYELDREKKDKLLLAVAEGLIRRSFVVAERRRPPPAG